MTPVELTEVEASMVLSEWICGTSVCLTDTVSPSKARTLLTALQGTRFCLWPQPSMNREADIAASCIRIIPARRRGRK